MSLCLSLAQLCLQSSLRKVSSTLLKTKSHKLACLPQLAAAPGQLTRKAD